MTKKNIRMWKTVAFFLAFLILAFSLVACDGAENGVPQGKETIQPPSKSVMVPAKIVSDELFQNSVVNGDRLNETQQLPMFRIDSADALESFQSTYRGELYVIPSYGGKTFDSESEKYDESFFEEKTLFAVYLVSGSGSFEYEVSEVSRSGSTLCVGISKLGIPSDQPITSDVQARLILFELPNEKIENCTQYDAYYVLD